MSRPAASRDEATPAAHGSLEATAVVLAGGRSSRFGTDKALVEVGGRPLIAGIVEQLIPLFREILVSARQEGQYEFLGVPIVVDSEKGEGPLVGIASALKVACHDVVFFVPCDVPLIDAEVVSSLVALSEGFDCVVPIFDGEHEEPLFAVYRKSVLGAAQYVLKGGGRSVRDLFPLVRCRTPRFRAMHWYRNLNSQRDYHSYLTSGDGVRQQRR